MTGLVESKINNVTTLGLSVYNLTYPMFTNGYVPPQDAINWPYVFQWVAAVWITIQIVINIPKVLSLIGSVFALIKSFFLLIKSFFTKEVRKDANRRKK